MFRFQHLRFNVPPDTFSGLKSRLNVFERKLQIEFYSCLSLPDVTGQNAADAVKE